MNMYRSPLKELKNFPASLGQADLSCPVQSAKVIINTAPPKLLFETPGVGYGGRGEAIASSAPKTPLKSSGQRSKPVTPPLTPMANLKVLIAAASSARENENEKLEVAKMEKGNKEEDSGGRKMKSLAILCKKFLSIAEEIGVGTDFSLETMSKKLGTNRRRIYDIINVLEALEMIVKQSKNWYTWLGQENLLVTLAKMRAMAEDDADFRSLLNKENGDGHDSLPPPSSSSSLVPPSSHVSQDSMDGGDCKAIEEVSCAGPDDGSLVGGGRWDKSLGVLCQKFIMLFLVTPDNEVTLDFAGNILMPDDSSYSPHPSNPKSKSASVSDGTKVRRLYDIANVLTTIGLIRKKTFLAPNHRKMPGYSWAGPSLDEIQTISVFRKSEATLYPFYSKRKGGPGGVALTRKPSFGSVRPFLHQYEVKGHAARSVSSQPNSAPSTPVKTKESGFKRSLSFGAGVHKKTLLPRTTLPPPQHTFTTPPQKQEGADDQGEAPPTPSSNGKCVLARPLACGQVDYLQEVKEFEAEIQKQAHKFPHVAPVFREFVQKFQSTLEQAAASGRSILPKADSACSSSTPSPSPSLGGVQLVSPQLASMMASAAPPRDSGSPSTNSAVTVSPQSAPGSGNATPSVTMATHGTLSPCSKLPVFTNVENLLASHRSQLHGCSIPHTSFNPNSLLVTAAPAYSLWTHPSSASSSPSSFLPLSCYSFPLSSVMVPAGVKIGHVRSLAPKPECAGTDEAMAAPKRPKLDLAS